MKWFRHAFAVDPPGPAEPTTEQSEIIDWMCRQVVKRHLSTPALVALEVSRPLNYVGSQTMHALGPIMWAVLRQRGYAAYQNIAKFLEHRGSIEYIVRRMEEMEARGLDESSADDSAITEAQRPEPS
ncbi:MAG: hypothetical protein AAF432_16185 [Planctomycetota bacterium]